VGLEENEKISGMDKVCNKKAKKILKIQESMSILETVQQHKYWQTGYILRHDSLLYDIRKEIIFVKAIEEMSTNAKWHLQQQNLWNPEEVSWRQDPVAEENVINLLTGRILKEKESRELCYQ